MGKAVLISIKPRWCELIASDRKTIEVRKTRPKMLAPFKCYIYCTKAASKDENLTPCNDLSDVRNGKVIGEFTCDWCDWYKRNSADIVELALGSLVQPRELYEYMGQNDGLYGWHISGLQIYEQPKELSDFKRYAGFLESNTIKRPFQSWGYVEEME